MGFTVVSVIVAIVGAASSAEASRKSASIAKSTAKNQAEAQAAYEREVAAANAKALAEQAASKSKRIKFDADKLKKRQRALSAKAGLTLGVGTAEDITTETDILAQRDIDITMSDAKRRGQLGMDNAASRSPLLTQKAADIGKSAEAVAEGQRTQAAIGAAGSVAGAFGGSGTTADSDVAGTTSTGQSQYYLEGDYTVFDTSGDF